MKRPGRPPSKRAVRGCLAFTLGLWVVLGSCAVWTGTAGARLDGRIVRAVEEGVAGARDGDDPKHSTALRRELGPTADVPDRYAVEVIGGTRQFGVGEPKLYAWMERRAEEGGVLDEGILYLAERGRDVIVLNYYPLRESRSTPDGQSLRSVTERSRLPSDVEAFVRRKLDVAE